MAATNWYTTASNIKTHLKITVTTYDTLLTTLAASVSRAIDTYTRRQFYLSTETRYYDYTSATRMWFDKDLYTLTTFTNGDATTLTESTHFYLWPYDGPPYRRLDIRPDVGTLIQAGDTTQRAISVLGAWGYSDGPPDDVTQAATSWAAYIFNAATDGAGRSSVSIGPYSETFHDMTALLANGPPGDVRFWLSPYVWRNIRSAA